VTSQWKEAVLGGATDGRLPEGYRRDDGIVGRVALLEADEERPFSKSEFVGRAQVPHTTSAVEARIRRRHLKHLLESAEIDRSQPVLELGCADGLVTRHLLELGFQKLVSTDIVHATVAKLDGSLSPAESERVLLVLDDLLQLPLGEGSFEAVLAWGVLSVSGDFDRALALSWDWVAPGGYLLLAEPILESVLLYALVRGDLDEFRRILRTRTRATMWEGSREERYGVNPWGHYETRLGELPGATVTGRGGVNMLPSLVLGGITQDSPVPAEELEELSDLLGDPALDELVLWRQVYWLVRKG
jgi:SAM-dependent methyltransferase